MSQLAQDLKAALYGGDPFEHFPYKKYAQDITGGEIHPSMKSVFDAVKPTFVVEVGSWKGKSALHMAELLRAQNNKDFAVLCIDTWLGSIEHYTASLPQWAIGPTAYGRPLLYEQFMSNIMHTGNQDVIVPFPTTSITGAKWLSKQPAKPELIYIDADHDEDEVYADLCRYWPLVDQGGALMGDDFDTVWPGVICAVVRFSKENKLQVLHTNDHLWLIQKTA